MDIKSSPTVKRDVHRTHVNSRKNSLHKVYRNKCRWCSD